MSSVTEAPVNPVDKAISLFERRIDLLRQLKGIDEETPQTMAAVYAGSSVISTPRVGQTASPQRATVSQSTTTQPHIHSRQVDTGRAKGKPGPKPKAAQAAKTAPASGRRRNDKPLHAVICDVLGRPENEEGLNASEICEVIQEEGLWESDAPDISNMVQGQIFNLRKKQLVVRGDQRRYMLNPNPPEE